MDGQARTDRFHTVIPTAAPGHTRQTGIKPLVRATVAARASAADPSAARLLFFGVQPGKAANPVIMHARARYSTRIFGTAIRVKLVQKKQ